MKRRKPTFWLRAWLGAYAATLLQPWATYVPPNRYQVAIQRSVKTLWDYHTEDYAHEAGGSLFSESFVRLPAEWTRKVSHE